MIKKENNIRPKIGGGCGAPEKEGKEWDVQSLKEKGQDQLEGYEASYDTSDMGTLSIVMVC